MDYVSKNSVNNTYVGLMAAKGKEGFHEKFNFEIRPNDRLCAGMVQFVKKK